VDVADLLVMLVAKTRIILLTGVYMLCCNNPLIVFPIQEIKQAIGDTGKHLMFVHAMTGCDTVSAIYRQGKCTFNMQKSLNNELLDTFMNDKTSHDEVKEAGEKFLLKLYGAGSYSSLNEYRHAAYKRAITRSSLTSSFELAGLPPISVAAKQHSYRAYLTVQEWMGNSLSPTDWGWQ